MWHYTVEMEARQHHSAPVVVVTQRIPAPAYNAVAVSHDRACLQRRGRLSRPRRLATPWPSLATTPTYNTVAVSRDHADLLPEAVSRGLVYINIPGRTCLDELFIDYEQVTTWEARFYSNKLEANYHILSAVVCTGWFNGQAHESPPLQFG